MSHFQDEKIFFAGEATTSEFIGTVHGAYVTGIEAAKQIVDVLSD